jgi:hypothetical protein
MKKAKKNITSRVPHIVTGLSPSSPATPQPLHPVQHSPGLKFDLVGVICPPATPGMYRQVLMGDRFRINSFSTSFVFLSRGLIK